MIKYGATMDEIDEKIIDEMVYNVYNVGEQPFTILANKLYISKRTVRRRVNTLLNSNAIKVVAAPNPRGKQGCAVIALKVALGSAHTVAKLLMNERNIEHASYSVGYFDFIIQVEFDTSYELDSFVNSELTKFPDIIKSETMIISQPGIYNKLFHLAGQKEQQGDTTRIQGSGSHPKYKMDDFDQAILDILRENGLTRVVAMKTKLDKPESFIRRRINSMLDNGIFKFCVVPNPQLLAHEVWVTIGINVNRRSADSVVSEIFKSPFVTFVSTSYGRFNVIMGCRFNKLDMLNYFINDELSLMKGVNNIETFYQNRPLKNGFIIWPLVDLIA
jgi:Lrp/AsnC family transcriptional regulator, regulator for asnA, asnC and gidA